jgi:biotin transporter BioY
MMKNYVINCIIAGIESLILFFIFLFIVIGASVDERKKVNNLTKLLMNACGQTFIFACGVLIYAILINWIGIPQGISAVITVVAFGFFSLIATFVTTLPYDKEI